MSTCDLMFANITLSKFRLWPCHIITTPSFWPIPRSDLVLTGAAIVPAFPFACPLDLRQHNHGLCDPAPDVRFPTTTFDMFSHGEAHMSWVARKSPDIARGITALQLSLFPPATENPYLVLGAWPLRISLRTPFRQLHLQSALAATEFLPVRQCAEGH